MFGDDSEVEWNLKKLQATKTERRGQSVRGDYLNLVQISLVFQVLFWSADTN